MPIGMDFVYFTVMCKKDFAMTERSSKLSPWIAVIISALSLIAGGGWGKYYLDKLADKEAESIRLIVEYLAPIQTLLQDNKKIHEELYASYLEPGWGILESYVEKVQADGFAAHALMEKRIRSLDNNNDEILVLLKKYSGHVVTPKFNAQASEFREHAQAWSDRLAAIAEVISTGSQFPLAKPFPQGFPQAVNEEIAARGSNM